MQASGKSDEPSAQKGVYIRRSGRRKILLAILVLVTVILVFATLEPVFYPLTHSQKYSDLGILGPNQTPSNYPRSVVANQPFTLYGYLYNAEGTPQFYNILVKLGNQSTQISNQTSASAPVIASYYVVLETNSSTVLPLQLSIGQTGIRERLIFELWSYQQSSAGWAPSYTGDWDQIWLNVTV